MYREACFSFACKIESIVVTKCRWVLAESEGKRRVENRDNNNIAEFKNVTPRRKDKALILSLIGVLILVIAGGLLFIKDHQPIFNGDIVKDDDSYKLEFIVMNETDSHTLTLQDGEALDVDFSVFGGRVDLMIGREGEREIYKGNNIECGTFELTAPEAGDYTITVRARHASGSIKIETMHDI